jgi:hypothetical protein
VGNALSGNTATTADTSLANALSGKTTDPLAAAAAGGNTSANTAIADSATTALKQISDQLAALGAHASGTVQAFEKTTQDVLYDNNATGRGIGQLRLNTTRLNVISALSPKDTADVFSFTASTSGATKLSALINDPTAKDQKASASGDVRIQLFAKGKGLVADSDPKSGTAYTNYQALQKGTFNLSAGQYSIRMSRADGVDPQAKGSYNYALQLTQGTKYTQDYTTTEQGYTPGTDDPFGLGTSNNDPASILSGSMADAYSFISSLQPIGQSGTSKLLGYIYTTSA